MSEIRVLPLPKVTGVWDHDVSRYPDRIRIPMSDGKVVTYLIDSQLPHPCFMAAIRNIQKMKGAGDAATSNGSVVDEKHPDSLYHQTKRDATTQKDKERW